MNAKHEIDLDTDKFVCGGCGHLMVHPRDIVTNEKTENIRAHLEADGEDKVGILICTNCGDLVATWLDNGRQRIRNLSTDDIMQLPKKYRDMLIKTSLPIILRWVLRGCPTEHAKKN